MKKIVRLTEGDLIRLVKRVISEQSEIPEWAIGQSMNFYSRRDQSDNPYNVKISSNPKEISIDNSTGDIEMKVTGRLKGNLATFGLSFSCNLQNTDLGRFRFIGKRGLFTIGLGTNAWLDTEVVEVYNKTIAEKYFLPYFCSKNKQGKWVQKVENPDFSQKDMNKQQKIV